MTGEIAQEDSPQSARSAAPAKVNLGLRITGRRPDGYHLLQSHFVPLDLGDQVAVSLGPGKARESAVTLALEGRREGVPAGDDNLAVRAARAFLAAGGIERSLAIQLDKWIPVGAGLGGGSSDAGAVLRLLARLLPGAVQPDHTQGDRNAFSQLVALFRAPVHNYLFRCGLDRAAREDLLQEIFIKIHAAAATYRPERPLKVWIFTIAANTARSHFRKLATEGRVIAPVELSDTGADEPSSYEPYRHVSWLVM